MKRLPLFCIAIFACTCASAEWLTLAGSPGDGDNDYVQVDPTRVETEGSHRIVKLRLSLARPRTTSRDGIVFRSFDAKVDVDCVARNARYVSATYFGQPNFVGEPIAVRHFAQDDVRPMTLGGAPRELAARTINAACSVRPKDAREQQQPAPEAELLPR